MNHPSQKFVIHPEDNTNMNYWTKKWSVSCRDINNAILETGSVDPLIIKNTLRKNHLLPNWFYKTMLLIKDIRNIPRKQKDPVFIGLRKIA